MKERILTFLFNASMLFAGALIAILFFRWCGTDRESHGLEIRDTVTIIQKPIINNYSFTKPTLIRERVIFYDSSKTVLTRSDSDLIVSDYLMRREYADSVGNDTAMAYYNAIVEKNSLVDMKIRQWYRPKALVITKIKEYNHLLFGLSVGYVGKPSFGLSGSYQNKKFDYGATYDPFNRYGFITLKRKIRL